MNSLFSRALRLVTLLVLTASLLSGCDSALFRDIQNLIPLQKDLASTYPAEDIRLVVQNGRTLTISLVNSSFNDLSNQSKEPQAREIAQFAATRYASIDHIHDVIVVFVAEKKVAMVTMTTSDSHAFTTEELLTQQPTAEPGD